MIFTISIGLKFLSNKPDKFSMIRSTSLLFILSLLFASCGQDQLSGNVKSANYSTDTKTCALTDVTAPVCAKGKDYKNDTHAICDGQTQITPGHCTKTNDFKVCLSDGKTYGEKDAFELMAQDDSLKIKQYADCDTILYH